MTPRQFVFLSLLFGVAILAASFARPGSWETPIGSQPEPVKATIAVLAPSPVREPVRAILPSPFEVR